jgi:enoyl-CoA hydratase
LASALAKRMSTAEIAANPPLTVRGVKDVLDQQRISAVSASLRYVAAWNSAFLPSKDLSEGISATFAKRPPQFAGE